MSGASFPVLALKEVCDMKKIVVIFGTRPEAIKLCPLVKALKSCMEFDCKVCVTGQHREMLMQVLDVFKVVPDVDFALMRPNQTLGGLTARIIDALDRYLASEKPDVAIVQGDTTTALAGALAAFYHHIPVAHVEAGLRTGNIYSPWPEEANRVLVSRLAKWHFCPTETNRNNLLQEGVDPTMVFVTGNTVIDALLIARDKIRKYKDGKRRVLITGHRRENFCGRLDGICQAIRRLATDFQDVEFIYPVHLNPNVRETVSRVLSGMENVKLLSPQSYLQFVELMENSDLILTDSGGIQEEAPSLGKPVLVMRDTTERPEAVAAGTVKLVGTSSDGIYFGAKRYLEDRNACIELTTAANPYGDGFATRRIIDALKKVLP